MLKKVQLTSQNKILLISFSVFTLLYLILHFKSDVSEKSEPSKKISADTLIPRNHVLVPLEISNITTVGALIDQYGIIDLYSGYENSSNLIASKVKILKAPLNPNQYAVLVTENLSKEIMKAKGPFWAVVQNSILARESFKSINNQKPKKVQTIEIEYQTDSNL